MMMFFLSRHQTKACYIQMTLIYSNDHGCFACNRRKCLMCLCIFRMHSVLVFLQNQPRKQGCTLHMYCISLYIFLDLCLMYAQVSLAGDCFFAFFRKGSFAIHCERIGLLFEQQMPKVSIYTNPLIMVRIMPSNSNQNSHRAVGCQKYSACLQTMIRLPEYFALLVRLFKRWQALQI